MHQLKAHDAPPAVVLADATQYGPSGRTGQPGMPFVTGPPVVGDPVEGLAV